MSFDPTPEQRAAVTAAETGENLVITAGAGSGKTSTLKLIAAALAPKRGVYIAYNKAIATDAAKSFPANVTCRTAHSFAYRAVGHAYKAKLNGGRMTGRQMAAVMGIDRSMVVDSETGRELAPARLASLVMQTVNHWCHSADKEIGASHAARALNDVPGVEEVSHDLAAFLVEHASKAWKDLKNPDSGRLPFSHDMYVKVWALDNPVLAGDFILYDEAQDADPCIAGIVLAQRQAQLIAVGDESQAIYGWRGATDAMKAWPAVHRVSLTKSFRFGPAVADEANVFLDRLAAPIRIEGCDKPSTVGMIDPIDADAILCRTNAGVIDAALAIHYARTFAVVGGTDAIRKFAEAAESLMQGRRAAWHPDLGAFKNWSDVRDYVENDEGGTDLRALVRLVENYGIETLLEVAAKAVSEDKADVVLSTAHKAKGREWGTVVISSDFTPQPDKETGEIREPGRAELMLMYVAVTRAQDRLDAAPLAWAK